MGAASDKFRRELELAKRYRSQEFFFVRADLNPTYVEPSELFADARDQGL
jgi:hypothetical protein